ncbi:MAG: AAA family ATPase [bacterium]
MDSSLIQKKIQAFQPALALDALVGSAKRRTTRQVWATVFVSLLAVVLAGKGGNLALGLFCISFAIVLKVYAIEFFFNSYAHSRDADSSYMLASMLYRCTTLHPTAVFILSPFGRWTLNRCGVGRLPAQAFLTQMTHSAQPLPLDLSEVRTFAQFVEELLHVDTAFAQFLRESGVEKSACIGAAEWCEIREKARIAQARWWSHESLARIPGLAKDWAYGKTYHLDRFGRDVIVDARRHSALSSPAASTLSLNPESSFRRAEMVAVEKVLVRDGAGSALLVGDKANGVMDVIHGIARMIDLGIAYPEIEHKRLIRLDTPSIMASVKDRGSCEALLISIFNEVVKAGNVIVVIDEFALFVRDTAALGIEVQSLLAPYLSSGGVQLIAVSDVHSFHQVLEPKAELMRFFEKILLAPIDSRVLVELLESEIERVERRNGVFFTFPAMKEVVESAERYFSQGSSIDKAHDLIAEIAPFVRGQKRNVVERADVLSVVSTKTGIPLGEASAGEKDVLLKLESILHQRIVGQAAGIQAISNAMRRARSGVNNPKRPMGSFLFIGPTGVGKTEMTKALASVFFGSEDRIMRFDMSEYRTPDALERLIGSASGGAPGLLASHLRDQQYGVLLLDEFEKTNSTVHDLFLQILDEGFFTDASGERVNARNTIIIATSNAGSDVIWKLLGNMSGSAAGASVGGATGTSIADKKSEIIDSIVERAIFKPELLNRFDDVVLFQPLSPNDMEKVGRLMLAKLNKRLDEKGVSVEVTDELVAYLVKEGCDQKFGARAMNRAIQEKVEQAVAKALLKGEAKPGTVLHIRPEEL